MTEKPKFEIGQTVFLYTEHGTTKTKIEKIYKNGNVVLEGSTQQYRPGRNYAHATGGIWVTGYITPWTEKLEKDFIRANEERSRRTKWLKLMEQVEKKQQRTPTNEQLSKLNDLVDALKSNGDT